MFLPALEEKKPSKVKNRSSLVTSFPCICLCLDAIESSYTNCNDNNIRLGCLASCCKWTQDADSISKHDAYKQREALLWIYKYEDKKKDLYARIYSLFGAHKNMQTWLASQPILLACKKLLHVIPHDVHMKLNVQVVSTCTVSFSWPSNQAFRATSGLLP
jgi:hypothetical protein